eukprot:TRINITY_DN94348_c0_g1_i1.p1 TRINITY_DN94348_c0_g1~~TRINITY_DN94348_c0_g1_i1.p1  ORF type:complete len:142 (-),score=22.39 TRINITY_DN94348_c0_g1_i1:161-529(-)
MFTSAGSLHPPESTQNTNYYTRRAKTKAVLKGCFYGAVSAVIVTEMSFLIEVIMEPGNVAELVAFYLITSTLGLLVSTFEILLLFGACLTGAAEVARACGLQLWPLTREKAIVAGALARAAL